MPLDPVTMSANARPAAKWRIFVVHSQTTCSLEQVKRRRVPELVWNRTESCHKVQGCLSAEVPMMLMMSQLRASDSGHQQAQQISVQLLVTGEARDVQRQVLQMALIFTREGADHLEAGVQDTCAAACHG